MQERLFELRVGETLLLGQYKVTLLDIEGDEMMLQIEDIDDDGGWRDEIPVDGDLIEA